MYIPTGTYSRVSWFKSVAGLTYTHVSSHVHPGAPLLQAIHPLIKLLLGIKCSSAIGSTCTMVSTLEYFAAALIQALYTPKFQLGDILAELCCRFYLKTAPCLGPPAVDLNRLNKQLGA